MASATSGSWSFVCALGPSWPCVPWGCLADEPQSYRYGAGDWFDYLGSEICGDWHMAGDEIINALAYVAGLGQASLAQASLPVVDASYYHSNLIGTTEVMTDAAGAAVHRAVYTAFGQPVYPAGTGVPPAGTRYGYAGAWGYQSGTWDPDCPAADPSACDPLAALGWLHVGERYYDPACGRRMTPRITVRRPSPASPPGSAAGTPRPAPRSWGSSMTRR